MKSTSAILVLVMLHFVFLPKNIFGQQFQNLNKEFPISLSEEIFEDANGFLWIGTINGLLLYDGYSIRSYRHNPNDSTSLAANNINAIGQDRTARIWVGLSRFGFSVLDQNRKSFIHQCLKDASGNCIPGWSVNAFSPKGDSAMWVGSTMGLYVYSTMDHPQLLSAYRYDSTATNSLSNDYVLGTYTDSKGRLWVGTNRGINLFDEATGTFVNYRNNPSFPSQQTLSIAEDHHGKVWVTTRFVSESLVTYDELTEEFVPGFIERKPYTGEFRATFDRNNDLWLVSRGVGAYHYDMDTGQRTFFDPANFKDHGYRNVYGLKTLTDRTGNIWITGNNLLKWPATGKAFSSLSSDENPVNSIYADQHSIWYSDLDFKLYDRLTKRTTSLFPSAFPTNLRGFSPEKSPVRIVYCIRQYDDNHLILATTRNVFIWNIKTNEFKEFPLDLGGPIREFVITPDKKYLWICSNQGTPGLFDLEKGEYSNPDYAKSIRNPRCVAQESNGDLWFGSGSSGLFYLNAETHEVQNFTPDHTDVSRRLYDYSTNDIVITAEYIWVASNLGLQRISKATHTVIPMDENSMLVENSFMSILEDSNDVLWLGTQQGLLSFNPKNNVVRSFNRDDGLMNAAYTQGACFKDAQGNLYFGGENGIDYFDPSRIGINEIPPQLSLGAVLANNIPIQLPGGTPFIDSIQLKHTEKFLEIELLGIHYTSPGGIHYAYRIPELDTSWRDLGKQRKITLANMPPGSYTLQARAANADDIWCDAKTLLYIKIASPYWATWWFISLCLIVLLTLIAFAYRYRIVQIKARERLKSSFDKRLAELESKALRSQMNPHFLFNSLNSVKSLISQGDTEKATQYITRFAQLIRQILANSEKPFVRLQEELEALRLYLEIEKLRFQNFTFEINVKDNVNVDFIEVPPLILQPYVENAIWHGLMHLTSADRRLTVDVAQDQQFLHLTIEDNGIGREQAQQIKSLGNSRKGGMGMRLTEDRLHLLKSIYGQEVKITITDLVEKGIPAGTRVEVQIPCVD